MTLSSPASDFQEIDFGNRTSAITSKGLVGLFLSPLCPLEVIAEVFGLSWIDSLKKITFFCEKAILESLSSMALSNLERQAFLPSQARRVDIATGHGIAMVYARKGFRSLKDCYKTPVYKHHLCMRFLAALQAAKTVLAYTMAMPWPVAISTLRAWEGNGSLFTGIRFSGN